MSTEKKQDDLKSFEAALAALVPRTDRLDRDRLMFLAGQQSVVPSTFGRGARGEGKTRLGACPAAFAAMTVVAAALLIMLVVRPGSKDAENIVKYPAAPSAPTTDAKETTLSNDYAEQPHKYRTYFDLAFLSGTDNRIINEAESSHSNAALLRQILAKGVDSWNPRETGAIDGNSILDRPLTNRELMDQLLNQPGAGPS